MSIPETLGWQPFYQQQLSLDDLDSAAPVRVSAVHRSEIEVLGSDSVRRINRKLLPDDDVAVGDWLLLDTGTGRPLRLLERRSLVWRKAAGERSERQLIAANIDTLFIVTSCNRDFNESRLERYLALAHEAGIFPVVIITKTDACDDPDAYRRCAERVQPGLVVECVNALDPDTLDGVRNWCGPGQTVALVGSSGVGKTTLTNALAGTRLATSGIRENDARGRHTTTYRSLHPLADGGMMIDSPGMRELQLADVEEGLEQVFGEIAELAKHCRFADCSHDDEPGCAVREALENGSLDERRWRNYTKLLREQTRNSRTLAESREHFRRQGKLYKKIQSDKRQLNRATRNRE